MGNQCSCFNNSSDNNTQDLSNKINNTYKFSEDENNLNNKIFDDGTMLNIEIKNEDNILDKEKTNFSKTETILFHYSITMNKVIKGYLFRKKYNEKLKKELEKFQNKLYMKFVEKSKNEKVEKIIKENTNLLSTSWKDLYNEEEENPMKEINSLISETKRYKNSLIFNYPSDNNTLENVDNINNSLENNNNNSENILIENLIEKTNYIYKGETNLFTGEKIGNGEIINKNGSKIIGTFYNNESNGWNKYINEEGILYLGLFKNGKLNGKGILYNPNLNVLYKGDFINNLKEGNGIEITNASKFEGKFIKDKKNGFGKINFNNGDFYEGNFLNNKFDGKGHFFWKKNNNEYIGNYTNGVFNGEGLYKWSENQYYKGNYINGIKEGKGEIKFSDGKKFICNFENGKPNGIGIFVDPKGNEKEVQFINGKLNKEYKQTNYKDNKENYEKNDK